MADQRRITQALELLTKEVAALKREKKDKQRKVPDFDEYIVAPVCPSGFTPCDQDKLDEYGLKCPPLTKLPPTVVFDEEGNLCYATADMAKILGEVPRNIKGYVNNQIERLCRKLKTVLAQNPEMASDLITNVQKALVSARVDAAIDE